MNITFLTKLAAVTAVIMSIMLVSCNHKTAGIDGEPNFSYSYISGTNSESMKITPKTKMDKMPRARRIFILHVENQELIEQHILEICEMLKFGFGRWNELMTYPFPFKFPQEFLDDAAETAYSIHWKNITYKKGPINKGFGSLSHNLRLPYPTFAPKLDYRTL
ncbi:MAG: hypothetical protein MJ198_07955 [Bacteroidales bacterium]|nr:hypothetical protein [Bacteroidales bacterium]